MKAQCPICDAINYSETTLKDHLCLIHGSRFVLTRCILDLLDHIADMKVKGRGGKFDYSGRSVHNADNCLLCQREAEARKTRQSMVEV